VKSLYSFEFPPVMFVLLKARLNGGGLIVLHGHVSGTYGSIQFRDLLNAIMIKYSSVSLLLQTC